MFMYKVLLVVVVIIGGWRTFIGVFNSVSIRPLMFRKHVRYEYGISMSAIVYLAGRPMPLYRL